MKLHYSMVAGWLLAILAGGTTAVAQKPPKKEAAGSIPIRKEQQPAKDSTFEIYGFAQADAIYDFKQNDPLWFDVNRPSRLPRFDDQFGEDGHTWLSARQTRFGVKTSTPVGNHTLKTHFEWDLFGVGPDAGQTTIRLRYAYGQWGQVGAGQLPSVFMDNDVFPNILDYWGPNGMLFFRNVLVYWQPVEMDNGTRLTFAVERPGASGDQGNFADRIELKNIIPRFPWPDFTASYRLGGSWGHAKLGGIVRPMRWDDVLADTFDLSGGTTGWGVALSGNVNIGKHDILRLMGVYGKGIENYFNDAPIDVGITNNFSNRRRPILGEALPASGLMVFLDHNWTKIWSTSIGYSRVGIDNSSGQAPDAFRVGDYGTINLLSTPVPNVMIGGEFQWGRRTNFSDGFQVNDYRLQFSFKYSYAHKFGGVTR